MASNFVILDIELLLVEIYAALDMHAPKELSLTRTG
jgi:hypothetical protein